jgi:thioredoxin-like negative regulator of GroEL
MQDALPRSLPSLILFRDGSAVAKHNGVITEEELDEFLAKNLAKANSSVSVKGKEIMSRTTKTASSSSSSTKKGFIRLGADRDDYMLGGLS